MTGVDVASAVDSIEALIFLLFLPVVVVVVVVVATEGRTSTRHYDSIERVGEVCLLL